LSFYFCSCFFFFSSRRRHTRFSRDWSSDVCSSDLKTALGIYLIAAIATMLVWGSETYAGVGTGYDMLAQPFLAALMLVMWVALRSEERRVGKEGRFRRGPGQWMKNSETKSGWAERT